MSAYKLIFIYLGLALAACGTSNIADCDKGNKSVPCSARTDDENAHLALDNGDFTTAITLLDGLIAQEPQNYERYPLSAAAHAGRAGISILTLAQSELASGGGGLVDAVGAFLPDIKTVGETAYNAAVSDMNVAVERLTAIPADKRTTTSPEKYAASALLQLGLYQTVFSLMYLNKFTVSATSGQFDPNQLATMTDADAAIVLDNLAAVAQTQAEGNPALQAKVADTLAQIDAQDAGSQREKLQAYIAKKNQPAANFGVRHSL